MNTFKKQQLRLLGSKRKQAKLAGYWNLSELSDGAYDCDYVSPYTKTAANVDSPIFVFLQDWSSRDNFPDGEKPDPEVVALGYTPNVNTNKSLQLLLSRHLDVLLKDIYASNVFPLIKPGGMSAAIPRNHMKWGATEFALPQIAIVKPRLVVVLGKAAFNAMRSAAALRESDSLNEAIQSPFEYESATIWCQAHTGWGARHRGSSERVNEDWAKMAAWFRGLPYENVDP